ncbi:hypothetical protein HanPSC8_Chr10g0420351 [Helianthus annuus]|nr:hypothetical protein HanPSC8_Chr10g0420351 [Helianthus annuus]
MASKDQDLVKHGTNLPNYLYQYEGKTGNTLEKMYNFGVLDWSRVENWKSNTKVITKTNNNHWKTSRVNYLTTTSLGQINKHQKVHCSIHLSVGSLTPASRKFQKASSSKPAQHISI